MDRVLMVPGELRTLADFVRRARPSWMAMAACRSRSDVVFVPSTESATATAAALALCAACPAKAPCLAHALDDDSLLGAFITGVNNAGAAGDAAGGIVMELVSPTPSVPRNRQGQSRRIALPFSVLTVPFRTAQASDNPEDWSSYE